MIISSSHGPLHTLQVRSRQRKIENRSRLTAPNPGASSFSRLGRISLLRLIRRKINKINNNNKVRHLSMSIGNKAPKAPVVKNIYLKQEV